MKPFNLEAAAAGEPFHVFGDPTMPQTYIGIDRDMRVVGETSTGVLLRHKAELLRMTPTTQVRYATLDAIKGAVGFPLDTLHRLTTYGHHSREEAQNCMAGCNSSGTNPILRIEWEE